MDGTQELAYRLHKIEQVFDTERLLSVDITHSYIQRYWKINQRAYDILHTRSGKIYIGISRDGVYKDDDLLEAARFVEKYIRELNATRVLELATGRGATSAYLAEKFPQVEFEGIDLSPGQLEYAYKRAAKIKNYHPAPGDYHDLGRFANDSFDVALVNE